MASNSKQITRVPVFLKAATPEELSKSCLRNNLKYQIEFHYFKIDKVADYWIAWFYADITKYPFLKLKENEVIE